MLRLGKLDISGNAPITSGVPPALITRTLEDLASERFPSGGGGYAVEQFCAALLDTDPKVAQACIDRLLLCGVTTESIYDAFIPRAATRLGDLWNEDHISFTAVALGMTRLTEVFRRLSPTFLKDVPVKSPKPQVRQALFALAPGEMHALGVVMAADYFRRNGWAVRVELQSDTRGLERIVRAQPFDLIGLSSGSRCKFKILVETLNRLRSVASPSARFALGGAIASLEPDLVDRLGVDIAPRGAQDAVTELEKTM